MYEPRQPSIKFLGPAVLHDQACAVMPKESAVYNLNTGIFHPSWKAREKGFHLVHAKTKFQKWLIKSFFKDM